MRKTKHQLAMEIVAILIESGLSLSDQLKVLQNVRLKVEFCRKTGQELKQQKLDL